MKQLAELVPVIVFFVVYQMSGRTISIADWHYQLDGIYSATAALMIATVLQLALTRLITGEIEKRLWYLLAVIMVFGGATLVLHDRVFIQWKPTIFNWGLAVVFLVTRRWTGRTAMERLMGGQMELPDAVWGRLNALWIGNFVLVGALNLVVAYGFSEAAWVRYKLYSMIAFTLLLTALTVLLVMPHLESPGEKPPGPTA